MLPALASLLAVLLGAVEEGDVLTLDVFGEDTGG